MTIQNVAAVLALLGALPLWQILPQRATGLAGVATADAAAFLGIDPSTLYRKLNRYGVPD